MMEKVLRRGNHECFGQDEHLPEAKSTLYHGRNDIGFRRCAVYRAGVRVPGLELRVTSGTPPPPLV